MHQAEQPWYRTLSRYQWLVLTVAWLGWVFDIADTVIFNLVKTPMLKEIMGAAAYEQDKYGAVVEGRIQMIFLLGWSIGGLVFGILADRWGRTRTLTVTILIYCVLTGITALCQTVPQVMFLRFLTGLGIGGEWAAGAALVAEVLPNRTRAAAASVLQSAAAVGPVLAALASKALADQSWRWLFVVGVLPALIVVIIRLYVKEPERWRDARTEGSPVQPLSDLFSSGKWRRNAIVAMIVGAVGIAGAGIVPFWLPNIVESLSTGMPQSAIQGRKADAMMILHIGTILGVIFFPWLCNQVGRKVAFAAFFLLSPLALGLLGSTVGSYSQILWLSPITSFLTIGLSAGFALYFPELFPTRFRATGLGLAYNTGRVLSAPVPALTGKLIASMGAVGAGVLATGAIYLIGLLALPFAPETKGKPLPEDEEAARPAPAT